MLTNAGSELSRAFGAAVDPRRVRRPLRKENAKEIPNDKEGNRDLLQSYPWPGNIRELQNFIERSVIVCETENFSVDESGVPGKFCTRGSETNWYGRSHKWREARSTVLSRS